MENLGASARNVRGRGRPKAWDDKTEQNTIKSLDRAMAVLDHLSTLPGVTLSDLAQDLDQSPATVYRILVTLELRGIVELDPVTQAWHVGPRAFVIGARFLRRTSLVDRARPVMRELMEAAGETANLGIARGVDVLFVSQVESHASIRAFFPPGALSPMHASGIGKALLANMPEDRLQRLLMAGEYERFTEHTLTDPVVLAADLGVIRTRGYSVDDEEKNIGMRCVAAPVRDWHGEVTSGISVSGPTSRVTPERVPELAALVVAAAEQLSQALGAEGE